MRQTFGKLARTEAKARQKLGAATLAGWIFLKVESTIRAGETFWRVTGEPAARNLEYLDGVRPGTNAPRGGNPKRRHDQRYRFP